MKDAGTMARQEIDIDPAKVRLATRRRFRACTSQEIPELIRRLGCYHLQRAEVLETPLDSCP